jgi:hypothetical protein
MYWKLTLTMDGLSRAQDVREKIWSAAGRMVQKEEIIC